MIGVVDPVIGLLSIAAIAFLSWMMTKLLTGRVEGITPILGSVFGAFCVAALIVAISTQNTELVSYILRYLAASSLIVAVVRILRNSKITND